MMTKQKRREDGDNANNVTMESSKKKHRSLFARIVVVAAIGVVLLPLFTEDGFHRDYLSALKSSESESRTRDLEHDQEQHKFLGGPTTKTDTTSTTTKHNVHDYNRTHSVAVDCHSTKASASSEACLQKKEKLEKKEQLPPQPPTTSLPTNAPTSAPTIMLPTSLPPVPADQNPQPQEPTNSTTTQEVEPPFPRQIYICGFKKQTLYLHLFPEQTQLWESWIRLDRKNARQSKPNDILVVGEGGYCDGWGERKLSAWGMEKRFKGKVVHINGESFNPYVVCEACPKYLEDNDGKPPARQYHIGYEPDGPQSVQVTFLAMFFVEHFWDKNNQTFFDALVVPEQRPINTGERFLIYSAKHCVDFREAAFDRFALLHLPNTTVDHASKCNGTIPKTNVEQVYGPGPNSYQDNYQFFHKYRFCLVLENAKVGGYITEKILAAFLGGCIPIYYGTLEIFDIFNPKAFVYYDIEDPQRAVELVRQLEQNKSAYQEMLREPILRHGRQTMEDYFSLTDEIVPNAKLKQKIRDLIFRPES